MVAMLAFGGTFAYFTATADKATSANITVAKLALKEAKATATLTNTDKDLLPGETLTVQANVTNESTREMYVFVKISLAFTTEVNNETAKLTLGTVADWTDYHTIDATVAEGTVFYKEVAAAAEVSLSATATFEATATSNEGVDATGTMGATAVFAARFAGSQKQTDVKESYKLISTALDLAQ